MDYITYTVSYTYPIDDNILINLILNHIFKKVKLIMKYPKLLDKIYTQNDDMPLFQHMWQQPETYQTYIIFLEQYFFGPQNILMNYYENKNIIGAVAFPNYRSGCVIDVRIGGMLVNQITIDEKKTYYHLVKDVMIPLLEYHGISLECSTHPTEMIKPVIIMFICLETKLKQIFWKNRHTLWSRDTLFRTMTGMFGTCYISPNYTRDCRITDLRTYNLHWSVNKIQNFYLYSKKRHFVEWQNKISCVNDQIRTLPDFGIDYFNAMEHFETLQTQN